MKQSIKWLHFWMAFLLSTLEFGLVFSFGALFSAIRDTFETDRPTTATVQSLLMGVASCFCAVSGVLINKLGLPVVFLLSSICVSSGFALSFFITEIWHLFATISVLAGVGISMIYVSTITLTSAIFSGTQKSLCIAIQGACVPFAGLFYPYLLDLLVSTYGLRGTFLVLSGVFCNSFAFSLMVWLHRADLNLHTVKRNIATEQKHQSDSETSTKGQLFTNLKNFIKNLMTKRFICLLVATAISVSTSNGFLDFVFDISQWKGFNNSEAKMSFVAFNICGVIFCVTPGLIKQISDIDTYFYPFGLAVIAFIGSIAIWYANSFAAYTIGLACMSAVPGLLSSAFMICANLVHLEQVSVAIGMFDTLIGFLSAGIGPTYGVIRDKTGHYNAVFLIFAVAQGIASLLFIGDIISRKLKLPSHKDIDGIDNTVNDEC